MLQHLIGHQSLFFINMYEDLWSLYEHFHSDHPLLDQHVQSSRQESHRSHVTSSRQTGTGNNSRDREQVKDGHRSSHGRTQDSTEMRSQYQKDFPPPSACWRRRTPALPQPDNIGINPAFRWEKLCWHHQALKIHVKKNSSVSVRVTRIEFRTIQRDTYPGWPITMPMYDGRLRKDKPNTPSEKPTNQSL